MPEGAPQTKIDATRAFGASVEFLPRHDLFTAMEDDRFNDSPGFIHPFRDKRVSSGNGTIGLEILEDLDDVQTVYAPLGGGGLSTGVAAAIKALRPDVRVIGVEPEGCCAIARALTYWESRSDGMRHDSRQRRLTVRFRRDAGRRACSAGRVVTVPDDETRAAIFLLATKNKIVAEPAAALSVAAALATDLDQRGKTVCVVSGGSIDPLLLADILTNG